MNSIIVTNGYLEEQENPLWTTLDGEYVNTGETYNNHPCYYRVGDDGKTTTEGVIYFQGRRWKIYCKNSFGGWNLSQKEDPSLSSSSSPPLGQWQLQEGGGDAPKGNGYKAVFEHGNVLIKPAKRR